MQNGPKPKGPDEVRQALLEAATRQFVAKGLRASLRDIANDANVNLGLIHHHFGNKDDLLRAVFDDLSRQGIAMVDVTDPGSATRSLFELSMRMPGFARLAAWLMMDEDGAVFDDRNALIEALRDNADGDEHRVNLMLALTVLYGWTVFGDFLAGVFEVADRDGLHRSIADHIEQLAARAARTRGHPVD